MRYIILTLSILSMLTCKAQLSKDQARQLAESVIRDSVGSSFLKEINYDDVYDFGYRGTWYGINSAELRYLDYKVVGFNDTVLYTVNYRALCDSCGITNKIIDFSPANFNISLFLIGDRVYLDEISDPQKIYEINNRYQNSQIINSNQAIKTASDNAPNKSRKTNYKPQLAYYSEIDQFIWIIKRAKGHSTVTEYSIAIDAHENKFIDIKETEIHRGFFRAIGDWFGGFY